LCSAPWYSNVRRISFTRLMSARYTQKISSLKPPMTQWKRASVRPKSTPNSRPEPDASSCGRTTKSPMANSMAMTMVPLLSAPWAARSSSVICCSAENCSAPKPMRMDSTRAATPRNPGHFQGL
jgi:hypothetical protein